MNDQKVQAIRAEFPILQRSYSGFPLGYLDNAATVQKPKAVLEAMNDFYQNHYANVHRASYDLSAEASSFYEEARQKVASFIAAEEDEVIFLRSATEAINAVAFSWGERNIGPEDTIVLTEMEHHANIIPWHMLAKRKGARIVWVSIKESGELDRESFSRAMTKGPSIVALTHVSNILGALNPVKDLAAEAKEAGAAVLIDGAQAAGRLGLDVKDIGADFYVFSGHKAYGPTGIGVLYGKKDVLSAMPPFEGGGGMISKVSKQGFTFRDPPARFEAGTPPIAEAVGLAEAISWMEKVGLEDIRLHEQSLSRQLLDSLRERGIYSPGPLEREGIVSFDILGVHSHDVSEILNRQGLALRSGHHCSQVLMQSLGVSSLTRASFAAYNTTEEVDRLLEGIGQVKKIFDL